MNKNFPSIWLEIKQNHRQNLLLCGCYREWSNEGLLNVEEQLTAIKYLTSQFEQADSEQKKIIVLGDVNLCSAKWNDSDFKLKGSNPGPPKRNDYKADTLTVTP